MFVCFVVKQTVRDPPVYSSWTDWVQIVASTFISQSLRQACFYQVVRFCTEEKEERVVLREEESCSSPVHANLSPTADRTADVLF